jgi:hypothetical protein
VKRLQWFRKWESLMKSDYQNKYKEISGNLSDKIDNYPRLEIVLEYKEVKFSVSIEWGAHSSYYYGFRRYDENGTLDSQVKGFLTEFPESFQRANDWWYGYNLDIAENIYGKFKSLADKVIESLPHSR